MKDILVLVNYMRTNPTIIDDIVGEFRENYKKIYIVNRNTDDKYKNVRKYKNVEIIETTLPLKIIFTCSSLFSLFRKECLDDLKFCIKEKRFSLFFLKSYFIYVTVANILYNCINKIPELKKCPEKITLMSLWFTSEAYAISRIKKKYPSVRCVSMAHAHEIETFDNKYTFYLKKFQHKYLDKILFISYKKMETYFQKVCVPRNINTNKCKVIYWGSRYFEFENKKKISNKPIIVSCSTVEGLKRVEDIARAISKLKVNVDWYHFGDGSEYKQLIETVNNFDVDKKSRCHIMGRKSNIDVKKFYFENDVALFINFSTTEGLPISVMEALSYGIPCMVTDVGGECEIINDGENGYIIPVETTVDKLAEYIEKHLSQSEKVNIEMKKNAKIVWENKFNLLSNIKQYYEELI